MLEVKRWLLWVSRGSVFLLALLPLIVTQNMIFPFVTGKTFFLRLILGLGVGCWAALAIFDKQYRPSRNVLSVALFVFLVIIAFASIFGVDVEQSLWSNFERMEGLLTYIYLGGLFLVASTTFTDKKLWGYLFGASLVVSVISAFWAFLQSTGAVGMPSVGRPYAGFGNSIYLSVYLLFHLFILGLLFLRETDKQRKWFFAAIFLFELYVFFLSASRGAFIGAVAGIFAISILNALYYRSRNATIVLGGIFGIVLVIVILITAFGNSAFVENITLLDRLSDIPFSDITRDARIMVWGVGIDAFLDRPILGWGPGNFIIPFAEYYNPELFGQEPWFDRTHNVYIEWLVGTGIVGFAAYMFVIIGTFILLWRLYKEEKVDPPTVIFLTGFFVAYLIQNLFIFDTITTYVVIILFWALLTFLYTKNSTGEMTPQESFSKSVGSGKVVIGGLVAVVIIVGSVALHARPILAANRLIDGLKAFPEQKAANEIVQIFNDALSYDTFGNTEIRERFATVVFQLTTNLEQFGPQFITISEAATGFFEDEVAERPHRLRGKLFLAQLKSIQATTEQGSFADAEILFKEAISEAPNYVQTYLSFSSLLFLQGKGDEALQNIKKVEELNIRHVRIVYPILRTYVRAGDLSGAKEYIQSFVSEKYFGDFTAEGLDPILVTISESYSNNEKLSFFSFIDDAWETEKVEQKVVLYLLTAQTYGELGDFDRAEEYALRAQQFDSAYKQQIIDFLESIERVRG